MKKAVLMIAVVFMTFTAAVAQDASDNSSKSRGDVSTDVNIKETSMLNAPDAKVDAPPSKGGEKARGSYCTVKFDNWTQWKIQCYLDGYYQGYVSGWGEGYVYTTSGSKNLYAVATFTDGSRLTWGPRSITCSDSFTWKLKP